jgi:hypothetical protein
VPPPCREDLVAVADSQQRAEAPPTRSTPTPRTLARPTPTTRGTQQTSAAPPRPRPDANPIARRLWPAACVRAACLAPLPLPRRLGPVPPLPPSRASRFARCLARPVLSRFVSISSPPPPSAPASTNQTLEGSPPPSPIPRRLPDPSPPAGQNPNASPSPPGKLLVSPPLPSPLFLPPPLSDPSPVRFDSGVTSGGLTV